MTALRGRLFFLGVFVNLTRREGVLSGIGALGGALLGIVMLLAILASTGNLGSRTTIQAAPISAPAPAQMQPTTAPAAKPASAAPKAPTAIGKPAAPGYVQTAGLDDPDQRAYQCAPDTQPVNIPTGQQKEADGSYVSVKPTADDYGTQSSVRVQARIGTNATLAAVIVNTGAHQHYPTVNPQAVLTPATMPGGTIDFTLQTDAYVESGWEKPGITDVTLCLRAA